MRRHRTTTALVGGLIIVGVICAVAWLGYRAFLATAPPWKNNLAGAMMERAVAGQKVAATSVRIELQPSSHRLRGQATLDADPGSAASPSTTFEFLLNPGLKVLSARVDGAEASVVRMGPRISVKGRPVAKKQSTRIEIAYEGEMSGESPDTACLSESSVLLPMLSFWYPIDLQSFSAFSCDAVLPETMSVAKGIAREDPPLGDGRRRVRWEEPRPVLGATLAAGHFQHEQRAYGDFTCHLYRTPDCQLDAAVILEWVGSAYNYYATQWGPDGFGGVDMVIANAARNAFNGGNGVIVLGPGTSAAELDTIVPTLALVARNWWGGTVTGRWINPRREAGAWLVEGMSEYAAWQAVRNRLGQAAYLRWLEHQGSPTAIKPLTDITLAELRDDEVGEGYVRVRGAYTALMIEEWAGKEAFATGCRNFLQIHRYATASSASLERELDLAAQAPLGDLFRTELDRTGQFDFGIADVGLEDHKIRVTIGNQRGARGFIPLEVALVGDAGIVFERVDPVEGVYEFNTDDPVNRVVLDPFFKYPDRARADNLWPRQIWPETLAASADGRLAITTKSEWLQPAEGITIVDMNNPDRERLEFPEPILGLPRWTSNNNDLCIRARSHNYRYRSGSHRLDPDETNTGQAPQTPPGYRIAGDVGWTPDTKAAVFFDETGKLFRIVPGAVPSDPLLDLHYGIRDSAVSPDAARVAWRDPAGNLRVAALDQPTPEFVQVPGTVLSYCWSDAHALMCLVAQPLDRLPLLCYATYSVYRVPTDGLQAEDVGIDPTRASAPRRPASDAKE